MNCASARCRRAICPFIRVKRGAADFPRSSEVQLLQALAHIDVILRLEIEAAWRADTAHFHIVGLGLAHRHVFMRQIGDARKQILHLDLNEAQLFFGSLQFIAQIRHFGHDRGNILALGLGLADLLGACIALGLQLLGAGLGDFAVLFQFLEVGCIEGIATASRRFATPSRSVRNS